MEFSRTTDPVKTRYRSRLLEMEMSVGLRSALSFSHVEEISIENGEFPHNSPDRQIGEVLPLSGRAGSWIAYPLPKAIHHTVATRLLHSPRWGGHLLFTGGPQKDQEGRPQFPTMRYSVRIRLQTLGGLRVFLPNWGKAMNYGSGCTVYFPQISVLKHLVQG